MDRSIMDKPIYSTYYTGTTGSTETTSCELYGVLQVACLCSPRIANLGS